MDKDYATLLLGSEEAAARWMRISLAVYREWPERLHPVMADRVYTAALRREVATALGLSARQYFTHPLGEIALQSVFKRVAIASVAANFMDPLPPEYMRTHCSAHHLASSGRKRGANKEAETGLS